MLQKNKKSQVTIFVIIAIFLIVAIMVFFYFYKKPGIVSGGDVGPENYLSSCIKNALVNATDVIERQGGSLNPKNYVLYNNIKVDYLCYTNQYYVPCVNQQPLLIDHVQNEIAAKVKFEFDKCVSDFKTQYGPNGKGYTIDTGNSQANVILQPRKIIATINMQLIMSKGKTNIKQDVFESSLNEPLYELVFLANEIVSQEITYRQFDFLGYMILHQEVEIDRTRVNEVTIYTLRDKKSSREFHFALRNWVMPPGF